MGQRSRRARTGHRYGGSVGPRQTRSIAALLASVFCSSTAVALLTTVLGKQVFDLTGSELALGLLGLAEFAPAALLVFVTGPMADRIDRRKLASVALAVQALTVGGLAWYAGTNPTSAAPFFILVVAFGAAQAFVTPAERALPADIVEAARLPWLVARQNVTWQAASIVGPVVGGFLFVVGVSVPYFVGGALVLAAWVAIALCNRADALSSWSAHAAGCEKRSKDSASCGPSRFSSVLSHSTCSRFCSAARSPSSLPSPRIGSASAAVGLGWLRAAIGIGAGAVTLVLTVRPVRRHVGATLLVAVTLFGLGSIVLGATTNFAVAFIALLALSGVTPSVCSSDRRSSRS